MAEVSGRSRTVTGFALVAQNTRIASVLAAHAARVYHIAGP
jgi:hypothetical protein